ncbi:MAG: pitrilysin family protein [Desulfuromonadia bacterium]
MVGKTILDNGIRVVSEFIPDSLSVSLGVWIDNGSSSETSEENGISHFLEHLLFKGTPTRTAHQIAHEIDAVGGVLNAFTSREFVCYYVKVLNHHFQRGFDLLADIVQHPLFPPDEIEKERSVILQEIRMLEDTPDDRVHDLFTQVIWEAHPLGAPVIGFAPGIERLTREQIQNFWQSRYRAGNIIIAAAGNVHHDTVVRETARLFTDIPPGRFVPSPRPLPHVSRKFRMFVKELEQEHICIGVPAFPQSHPDRYPLLLMNTLLGGSMSSRLFQEIREKRGLAYSIYSYLSVHAEAGAFTVYAGTTRDQCEEVFHLIQSEMKRLASEPVSEQELASAREQLKGNILLSLESSDNRMAKLAKNEFYHGCYIPLEEIDSEMEKVTPARLAEVAASIIRDDALNAVMLGPFSSRESMDE